MDDKKIDELDRKIDNINISLGKITTKIDIQEKTMLKLTESMGKLTTYIEKTNENDKKIETLFMKLDRINELGTKNCPVNIQRLKSLEKRISRIENYLIYVVLAVILQFLGIFVHMIDKHIHF